MIYVLGGSARVTTSDRNYKLYELDTYEDSLRQCEILGQELLDLRSAKEERMIDDFLKREFVLYSAENEI